ncbi:DUF2628 domain-containing protein [Vibrio profundum]|uniref:DUF2628 domain-containing protein n=1 Tax=Vibrio profundum TaxID=2910247 RepID=UPI003D0F5988
MSSHTVDIDDLKVSNRWKRRFKVFDLMQGDRLGRFGYMATNEYNELGWRDRYGINYNLWAFFFGFIYYVLKGMPYKACMILSLTLLWTQLLTVIDHTGSFKVPEMLYWFIPAFFCAMLANLDYYRKVVHEEKMWRIWPKFFHRAAGVILLLISVLIIVSVIEITLIQPLLIRE